MAKISLFFGVLIVSLFMWLTIAESHQTPPAKTVPSKGLFSNEGLEEPIRPLFSNVGLEVKPTERPIERVERTPDQNPAPAQITKTEEAPASAPSEEDAFQESTMRVLLIGDSLGVGLQGPLGTLVRKNGGTFDAVVKNSQTFQSFAVGEMKTPLEEALRNNPDIIYVSLGTNDDYARNYAQRAYGFLQTLKARLEQTGAKIIWIGPPTLGTYGGRDPTGEFIPLLEQTCANGYFDSRPLNLQRSDGLHPTGGEYRRWANAIYTRTASS